jgi:hypothetical protein
MGCNARGRPAELLAIVRQEDADGATRSFDRRSRSGMGHGRVST